MTATGIKFYNRIGFRLSVMIAGVIFCSVLAVSVFNATKSLDRETKNYETLVRGAASAYAATVADSVEAEDRFATLATLRGVRDLPNIAQVDITLADGSVLAELGTGAWLITEQDDTPSLWRMDHVRVELPIVKSGQEIGELGMLVDITPLRADILNNLVLSLIGSAVVIVISLLIAQAFIAHLTAPIRRLTLSMASIRDGDDKTIETLQSRKDETGLMTQTYVDMMGSLRDRDAQIARHMDELEDTVEERTRDLRQARDAAEAANAAKSDFLATMSHEIRTPMNGMMVMAEMLGSADLSPRHRRYADIIHRSGNSLLTIINDILDLSKIEAGRLDLELRPVSPEALVSDVISLFWERARSKALDLTIYVSPRVPEEITADPTRVNQVVTNLVNNALKFTETGGVTVRVDASDTDIFIDVTDTGIGIPADKIDHIFDSFSQADQSTTRRFGGTGLGLTVCKRLVTAMSGSISVTSTPGQGSTFHIQLPLQSVKPVPSHERFAMRVGLNVRSGLMQSTLSNWLQDVGCEICEQAPHFWLTTSDRFAPQSEPVILLSDLGDTQADTLLSEGAAVDSLPVPFMRSDLRALLFRAQTGAYRGGAAAQGGDQPEQLRSFEGLRVLAADDNAVNREVLREAMNTLKADATFVENGAEAVAAMADGVFDLVFMDGAMPEMDGFEATRQIREGEADTGRAPTPVFALTAQVAGSDASDWQAAGANGHILKPFTLDKLIEVMSTIDQREPASPAATPAPTTSDLLNLSTIQSLETLNGQPGGVRDKIWGMFDQRAPAMLEALCAAMQAGPAADTAKQAHALKSMALSSGLSGFSDALQAIEAQAKASDSPFQADAIDALSAVFEQSQSAMQAYRETAPIAAKAG